MADSWDWNTWRGTLGEEERTRDDEQEDDAP